MKNIRHSICENIHTLIEKVDNTVQDALEHHTPSDCLFGMLQRPMRPIRIIRIVMKEELKEKEYLI